MDCKTARKIMVTPYNPNEPHPEVTEATLHITRCWKCFRWSLRTKEV